MGAFAWALRRWVAVLVIGLGGPAAAQDAWVQIEARPTLAQAEERARAWAGQLENVVGYRLASGWYALAIGPYAPVVAEGELARLRAGGAIPGDSFLSDGANFRDRFWPVGATATAVPVVPEAAAPPPPPADETPAEARAAERFLSREEREDVQRALQAGGFYSGRIDGSFGPGTRRSMASWQAAEGLEATGILTTKQRADLVGAYRAAVGSLGLTPVDDARAGIAITLPLAEMAFAAYDAPFARYEGPKATALLISEAGDADTLRGLYDVMQTLEIVPMGGSRNATPGRFFIDGANDEISTHVEAVLTGDGVKGFGLIWPAGDEMRRRLVIDAMQASFRPTEGVVLPDSAGGGATQRPDLLAGLEIRQPAVSASGFYVDDQGSVLTAAETVAQCARITLDGEIEASVAARDPEDGLALLKPAERLAPIGIGRLRAEPPRLQADVAVAGYPYGGALGAPTISFGTLEDIRGLDGAPSRSRLALVARPGDSGGPVLDGAGGVLGLLLPDAKENGQILPEDVRFAANAATIAAFLGENGITLADPAPTTALLAEDIAGAGADMTVLVECWN